MNKNDYNILLENCKKYVAKIPPQWRYIEIEDLCSQCCIDILEQKGIFSLNYINEILPKTHARLTKDFLKNNPNARIAYNKAMREYQKANKKSIKETQIKYHKKIQNNLEDPYIKQLLRQSGYSKSYIDSHPELIEEKRNTLKRRIRRIIIS